MSGDVHVRFWEGAGVRLPRATHLPLHRQVGIVARSGVRLSRSTLCDGMASVATLLRPLVALMRTERLKSRVIHSDGTSVPFLERGRGKAREGHLWVCIGDRDHPYVVFDFTPHDRRDGPERAPWLRFVWSCRESPDPAGRRRVKRSVYLHPKGARGQQHADEAT